MKKTSLVFSNIVTAVIILLICYFAFAKPSQHLASDVSSSTLASVVNSTASSDVVENGAKTFVFDNFHGSTDIDKKFQFNYPENYYNEGQYFSPQKIEHYDLYSVTAPFYFDLILVSIFDQTEFKNQIDSSKRNSPDSHAVIDGAEFKKYDLIDYGSYGGDSAGRVIIYVGPTIKINGLDYYLVFHWEEKPLTATIADNNPAMFERMITTFKFIK